MKIPFDEFIFVIVYYFIRKFFELLDIVTNIPFWHFYLNTKHGLLSSNLSISLRWILDSKNSIFIVWLLISISNLFHFRYKSDYLYRLKMSKCHRYNDIWLIYQHKWHQIKKFHFIDFQMLNIEQLNILFMHSIPLSLSLGRCIVFMFMFTLDFGY